MANIATLAVSITANTDKFAKGMASVGSQLAGMAGTVAKWGAAVAASAGAGLSVLVANSMESIDTMAKLADRLGASTEFLSGMQHAANLSGVSMEQLTGGLEKFIKKLPAGSDVGASFLQVAKDIQALQDPVLQAQAAMEAFGKSGQSLLPLLLSDIEGMQAEAEKLGLSFSRGQAFMVEAANDSMTKVKALITGGLQQAAIAVAPFIEAIANKLADMGANGLDGGKAVAKAFEWVAQSIASAADFLQIFKAAWHGFQASVSFVVARVLKDIALLTDGINVASRAVSGENLIDDSELKQLIRLSEQDGVRSIKAMHKAWGDFENGTNSQKVTQVFRDIQIEAGKSAKKIEDAAKARMEGNKGTAGLTDLTDPFTMRFDDFNPGDGAAEAAKKIGDQYQKLADRMAEDLRTPWEVFNAGAEQAAFLFKRGFLNEETYKRQLDKLAQERDAALGPIDAVAKAAQGIGGIKEIDFSKIDIAGLRQAEAQKVEAPKLEGLLKQQVETSKAIDAGIKNLNVGFA